MPERASNPPNNSPGEQGGTGDNRRMARRFPFVAMAELVEIRSGERIAAQTTQLSSVGCYTGALNPFAEGTEVRVRLSKDGKVFESRGRVLHVHVEFGMGIVFENVPPEQQRVLDAWLAGLGS